MGKQSDMPYSVSKKSVQAMLDSPIAFHKVFAVVCKSALSGLFLSQAFYWTGKSNKEDGWFYKTGIEWEQEIAMSRREIETARRDLRYLGLIEEDKRGVPCRVFYRVDMDALMTLIEQTSLAETSKLECTKAPNMLGGNEQTITENTQETTTENTNKPTIVEGFSLVPKESLEPKKKLSKKEVQDYALKFNPPARIPRVAWDAWIEMRIEKGNCPTPRAIEMAISEMDRLVKEGSDYAAILNKSTMAGYPGLYAASNGNGKSNGNGYQNGTQSRTNGSGQAGHLLDHLPSLEENQRRQREGDERLARKRAERGM